MGGFLKKKSGEGGKTGENWGKIKLPGENVWGKKLGENFSKESDDILYSIVSL